MGKESRIERNNNDKSRDSRRGVHIRKTIANIERSKIKNELNIKTIDLKSTHNVKHKRSKS